VPTVPGRVVKQLVSQQVLRALEPAALELSVQATQDVQRERDRTQQTLENSVSNGRIMNPERAARQHDAVEPENRLVARTLEQRWEEGARKRA